MATLKLKKGLDVPIRGQAQGSVIDLPVSKYVALDLSAFDQLRFNIITKEGAEVKIGDVIATDKYREQVQFVSPACGRVVEIIRGEKRRPLKVVIEVLGNDYRQLTAPGLDNSNSEQILSFLSNSGFLPHIDQRPCCVIPNAKHVPDSIFIKALESDPLNPTPNLQIQGEEDFFALGLKVLAKLCPKVHLVYKQNDKTKDFNEAKGIFVHDAKGVYPVCSPSFHIYKLHPIVDPTQIVWSLGVNEVVILGKLFEEGKYFNSKIIARAGEGLEENNRNFLKVNRGQSLGSILEIDQNLSKKRVLSGTYLKGTEEGASGYLGFFDTCVSILEENSKREPLHFLGIGMNKYTATKGYFSGFFQNRKKGYHFDSNQHGERRAFVESELYQRVMPMRIPVVELTKAVLAEDFEKAVEYGLLEVSADDFILPTFICPSKIEITEIIRSGLYKYSQQFLTDE